MISLKRQLCISILLVLTLLFCGAAIVWCYLHAMSSPGKLYHLMGKPGERARLLAVESNDFDALILGSSMSANFLCSDFDRLFHTNSLKLADSGLSMLDVMKIASQALIQKGKQLKYIQTDLTAPHFIRPSNGDIVKSGTLSTRLENMQDYVSFDMIRYAISFFAGKEGRPVTRDDYGIWYSKFMKKTVIDYFAEEVKKHSKLDGIVYEYTPDNIAKGKIVIEHDVFPLVKAYPDTIFIFFFAPYSLLAYEYVDLEMLLEYKRIMMDYLCPLPNVRLYDFQNAVDIASHVENYKDYSHYMQHINTWMLEQMAQEKYRVTMNNREEYLQNFRKTLLEYDFEKDRKYLLDIYEKNAAKK